MHKDGVYSATVGSSRYCGMYYAVMCLAHAQLKEETLEISMVSLNHSWHLKCIVLLPLQPATTPRGNSCARIPHIMALTFSYHNCRYNSGQTLLGIGVLHQSSSSHLEQLWSQCISSWLWEVQH